MVGMPREVNSEAEQLSTSPWGSLLNDILEAQRTAAKLLAGPQIAYSAKALAAFAQRRGYPVLVPASPMANRLVGAALMSDAGALRATDDGSVPVGEHVLLVEAVAAGTAGLRNASDVLLSLGAASVECVALRLLGDGGEYIHVLLADEPPLRLAR
jgi:hypothetical protein